ncbi:MAG: sigma-70 family RNA polymerase sigma factor [Dehalococcoidia bacterium]|nr:sigma-70 family RNA polymerase sigma factor [Dehalococcoidia bacterium]MCA9853411.1 sigma-70 family RNA polymerase sigma factor [Dehalococcoidia bacterium]
MSDGNSASAILLSDDDTALVARLREGEAEAFEELVDKYHSALVRFARLYVPTHELAEDVVQETWMGVLRGLDRFEGRSSLKTWIFRIAANRAQTKGKREARTVPFAALASTEAGQEESVEVDRFLPPDHAERPNFWSTLPLDFDNQPEARLLSDETFAEIRRAIDTLPPMQATVITLRDLQQWSSTEVREALDITEANQRVLLHRARTKVRRAIEDYFARANGTGAPSDA